MSKTIYRIWQGTATEYKALHSKIGKKFGKPKKCENCGTTEAKLYDWANISGLYKEVREDWKRLCRKCHMKEDGRIKGGFFKGHAHTEASKERTKQSMKQNWLKDREKRMATVLRGENHGMYKHGLSVKKEKVDA